MKEIISPLLGFMFAPLAFMAVLRWIALLASAVAQTRDPSGVVNKKRAVALAVGQSLFHAGPWSVAAAAFFGFHVRNEPWAPWFFGGFATGIGYMCVATVIAFRRAKAGAR